MNAPTSRSGSRGILQLNLRQNSKGGRALEEINLPLSMTLRVWERLIIFVHGYNVDRKGATTAFAAMEDQLRRVAPRLLDQCIGLYWPGDWGTPSKAINALAYSSEVGHAKALARPLADFIRDFQVLSGPCCIVLVGHSLGCRLILEALADLKQDLADTNRNPVTLVILMAAAVPEAYIQQPNPLFAGLSRAARLVVLHSRKDWVLRLAFPLGQRHAEGDMGGLWPEAIGLRGMPAPGIWSDEHEMRSFKHKDYWLKPGPAMLLARELGELSASGPAAAKPPPPNIIAARHAPPARRGPGERAAPGERGRREGR